MIDVDAIKRKMARDFMEEIEMMIGERMKEERKKICPQLKFMGEFAANLNAVNESKTYKIQKERDDEENKKVEGWKNAEVSAETYKRYEQGKYLELAARVFVIAISLGIDLNELCEEISKRYGIKPMEKKKKVKIGSHTPLH